MNDLTREEAKKWLEEMKKGYMPWSDEVLNAVLDIAISALSTEGEYIKKSELLQHVMTEELSDFKDCDVIHAEEIDELTTYSFPDSAENKVGMSITHRAIAKVIDDYITNHKGNIIKQYTAYEIKTLLISDDSDNKGNWIPVSERLPEKE